MISISTRHFFFYHTYDHHQDLHSFPTRRSSDLNPRNSRLHHRVGGLEEAMILKWHTGPEQAGVYHILTLNLFDEDRKSTRLNSSHRCISYAVFCLKKKKNTTANTDL